MVDGGGEEAHWLGRVGGEAAAIGRGKCGGAPAADRTDGGGGGVRMLGKKESMVVVLVEKEKNMDRWG